MTAKVSIKDLLEEVRTEMGQREEKEKIRKRGQHLVELREHMTKGAQQLSSWGNAAAQELSMLFMVCSDLPERIDLQLEADVWKFPVCFVRSNDSYRLCFPDNLRMDSNELSVEALDEQICEQEKILDAMKKSGSAPSTALRANPFPQKQLVSEMQRGVNIRVAFRGRELSPPTKMQSKNLGFWLVLVMEDQKGTSEEVLAVSAVVRNKTNAPEEGLLEISET